MGKNANGSYIDLIIMSVSLKVVRDHINQTVLLLI